MADRSYGSGGGGKWGVRILVSGYVHLFHPETTPVKFLIFWFVLHRSACRFKFLFKAEKKACENEKPHNAVSIDYCITVFFVIFEL